MFAVEYVETLVGICHGSPWRKILQSGWLSTDGELA